MSSKAYNDLRESVLSNPQAREVYYQERRRSMREREALEQAAADEHQRRAIIEQRRKELERLLGLSPAEAWMSQHEEEITADNAPTRGALRELVYRERLRMKAARHRLREVGIK